MVGQCLCEAVTSLSKSSFSGKPILKDIIYPDSFIITNWYVHNIPKLNELKSKPKKFT